jgi:hypothetical protein
MSATLAFGIAPAIYRSITYDSLRNPTGRPGHPLLSYAPGRRGTIRLAMKV